MAFPNIVIRRSLSILTKFGSFIPMKTWNPSYFPLTPFKLGAVKKIYMYLLTFGDNFQSSPSYSPTQEYVNIQVLIQCCMTRHWTPRNYFDKWLVNIGQPPEYFMSTLVSKLWAIRDMINTAVPQTPKRCV